MNINFTDRDMEIIYQKFKVELLMLENLDRLDPSASRQEGIFQELDILRSITEKIEASDPKHLDPITQSHLKEAANRTLKNHLDLW